MRRSNDLEQRLKEWADVYGGGQYGLRESLKSPAGTMMKWGGRPPTGMGQEQGTPNADEVQNAVYHLGKQLHGWQAAMVIQCEYLLPGQPIDSKLQKLRVVGVQVSDRARYSQILAEARKHVAAWLRVPYSALKEAEVWVA